MVNKILIELFSDMPTNEDQDCKFAGEFMLLNYDEAYRMIGRLVSDHVEFTAYKVSECLIDLSYDYLERKN